jgi:hypothetical protein
MINKNQLNELISEDAATLLMETYPITAHNYSEAFIVMNYRSWKQVDQIRLARFYLQKMPFASSKPYEVFASFMALPVFIEIIRELLPNKIDDQKLIAYHLIPVIRKFYNAEKNVDIVNNFIIELKLKYMK